VAVPRSVSRSVKQRIADDVRLRILDGSLPAGGRLPTEAELIEQHQVARNTVRDALAILVHEGLIEARRPLGYFVRERHRMDYRPQSDLRPRPDGALKDAFLTEQDLAGRDPAQSIDVAIVQPPPAVVERLRFAPGELAVVRRRVRFLEGQPFYSNDSYFPLRVAEGTAVMSPVDIPHGANLEIGRHGHTQVRAVDEFFVRMPTPEEVSRLELSAGTPVAVHLITGFGADGHPLRCVLSVLPGDRHVIIYDRPGLLMSDGDACG
jgi:GntR family transcriptional regulator